MKIMVAGKLLFRQVFEKEETQSMLHELLELCSSSYCLKTNVLKVIKAKIQRMEQSQLKGCIRTRMAAALQFV